MTAEARPAIPTQATLYTGLGKPAGTETQAAAAGTIGPVVGGMKNRPAGLPVPGAQVEQPAVAAEAQEPAGPFYGGLTRPQGAPANEAHLYVPDAAALEREKALRAWVESDYGRKPANSDGRK